MDWNELISIKNIYRAWKDFVKNKNNKRDVVEFKMNLEEEILQIRDDLQSGAYKHGQYSTFKVYDPKERVIHKAQVCDRVVHRLLYNQLLPIFNRVWLDCSFSCRPGFGQHLSIEKVRRTTGKATRNYSRECWVVKCDIRKFFNNINHDILFNLVCRKIYDENIRKLVRVVLESFFHEQKGVGIPIGNLTSQIFGNIYLHELDLFAKHELKLRYYYRYADDFIFFVETKVETQAAIEKVRIFLKNNLQLELHPKKVIIRKPSWGIDWLGKVLLPDYVLLRPATRRRMIKKIKNKVELGINKDELFGMVASYNGLLRGTARKKVNRQVLQAVAFCR